MEYQISLEKMRSIYGTPIEYFLPSDKGEIRINDLIGQEISLIFSGSIHCVVCGKSIKKTFAQGSCYDCFRNAPENAECIIRPELCQAHEGGGRDPEWERIHHDKPHYVYLALSSAVKVGVTREDQIPTRWIDQCASEGLILANCPNRYEAGVLEVYLKDYFTDKTNWQRMLKNEVAPASLAEVKEELVKQLPDNFKNLLTPDYTPMVLDYPVNSYPLKVKSMKLEKMPVLSGVLEGIKGQYWLFRGGSVWNVRSHSGFDIVLSC
jgi:hypothetical protein